MVFIGFNLHPALIAGKQLSCSDGLHLVVTTETPGLPFQVKWYYQDVRDDH